MMYVTDTHGNVMTGMGGEPEPGSVLLTNGLYGTAWQRYFSDGLWHRVGGGRPHTWDRLLDQRNVVLVYDAPVREPIERRESFVDYVETCRACRTSGETCHNHRERAGA